MGFGSYIDCVAGTGTLLRVGGGAPPGTPAKGFNAGGAGRALGCIGKDETGGICPAIVAVGGPAE